MIENSRRKLKNLDAAIICSRRPGYFSHYKNTDRVSAAEGKKQLTLLAKKLQVLLVLNKNSEHLQNLLPNTCKEVRGCDTAWDKISNIICVHVYIRAAPGFSCAETGSRSNKGMPRVHFACTYCTERIWKKHPTTKHDTIQQTNKHTNKHTNK